MNVLVKTMKMFTKNKRENLFHGNGFKNRKSKLTITRILAHVMKPNSSFAWKAEVCVLQIVKLDSEEKSIL